MADSQDRVTNARAQDDPLVEADARALVRLVAECAVVPGGLMAQKRHLMEGLAGLIDADQWIWNVSRFTEEGGIVAVSLLHNLSEGQLAILADENYSSPENPANAAMIALSRDEPNWSRRLEDMVDVEVHGPRLYTSRPELGIGQSLFTFREVPGAPDMSSCAGMHRSADRAPFSPRELRLAHILMGEVDWLHQDVVPTEDGKHASGLSPRLRTVLSLLIDGQSAKRIAYHLDLSPHTVRGYVKDIYKHFDVGSRSELMRHFMVGDGSDRAR